MKVVSNTSCTKRTEDWSQCRSPSRARRRLRRGYPQRVKITHEPAAYRVGDTIYAHPLIVEELNRHTKPMPDWTLVGGFNAR